MKPDCNLSYTNIIQALELDANTVTANTTLLCYTGPGISQQYTEELDNVIELQKWFRAVVSNVQHLFFITQYYM